MILKWSCRKHEIATEYYLCHQNSLINPRKNRGNLKFRRMKAKDDSLILLISIIHVVAVSTWNISFLQIWSCIILPMESMIVNGIMVPPWKVWNMSVSVTDAERNLSKYRAYFYGNYGDSTMRLTRVLITQQPSLQLAVSLNWSYSTYNWCKMGWGLWEAAKTLWWSFDFAPLIRGTVVSLAVNQLLLHTFRNIGFYLPILQVEQD